MPEVCAKNLSFEYENRVIFSDLNFCWNASRIGLIGRNGSGKSTLARLIAGLSEPSNGQLRVDGVDLFHDRKAALQKIGIVFQNPDHQIIFPTVIEELQFGFSQQSKKEAEQKALAVLEKYQKMDWKDRPVISLSQGQRHFLALISILEMRPQILIVDEPFTGLDIPTCHRLQILLDQFEGMIIHITHETRLIDHYEMVIWIEEGQIQAEGAANEVITRYLQAMKTLGESDVGTGF